MKKVLDVGNCAPDFGAISHFFKSHFDCSVEQADKADDALAKLKAAPFDLVTVNRKLDCDYTDGAEVIKAIKADPATADVPVMLVTNFAEHQDAAEQLGALRGFGKLEYDKPETLAKLQAVLG